MRNIFNGHTTMLNLAACCCFLLLTLLLLPSARAEGGAQPRSKTLTIFTGGGIALVKPNVGLWDCGMADPLDNNDGSECTLTHEFTLINDNDSPIVINSIRVSDLRLRYDLLFVNKVLPVTVASKDAITIRFYYHLLPLRIGKFSASAKVLINNQAAPAATLQCTGTVKDIVTFDPPVLDFGTLRPGQTASKPLKVTYDPQTFMGDESLPPEELPSLVSVEPFIASKRTAIGVTKRSVIAMQRLNLSGPLSEEARRNLDAMRRDLDALPGLNNVVFYLITVKAPTVAGAFHGFVAVMPVKGTPGLDLLEQRAVMVQGQVGQQK